jgi:hypothetical protein
VNAPELLQHIENAGGRLGLTPDGGLLCHQVPSAYREQVALHRSELLALLRQRGGVPDTDLFGNDLEAIRTSKKVTRRTKARDRRAARRQEPCPLCGHPHEQHFPPTYGYDIGNRRVRTTGGCNSMSGSRYCGCTGFPGDDEGDHRQFRKYKPGQLVLPGTAEGMPVSAPVVTEYGLLLPKTPEATAREAAEHAAYVREREAREQHAQAVIERLRRRFGYKQGVE